MIKVPELRIVAFATILWIPTRPVLAAPSTDQCSAVFADGVNDKFVLNSKSSVRTDVREWFCSESFVQFLSKGQTDVGLEIPLDGAVLPFKFSSKNDDSMEKRHKFCQDKTRTFSEQNALSVASSVASKDKINGWLECQRITQARRPSKLVQLDYEFVGPDGKLLVVTARWNHLEHTKAPLVKAVVTSDGLTCNRNNLKKGKALTLEGLSEICTRDPKKSVSLTVETTAGFVFASLPASTCGAKYGQVRLASTTEETHWVSDGRRATTISTGNHHCERKCRGEPTRTNYKGEIVVGSGERLRDPSLTCKGGPCEGWNQVIVVENVTPQHVRGSVDVWSKPTTWELSANHERAEMKVKSSTTGWQDVVFGKQFTISVDKQSKSNILEFDKVDGAKLAMNASDSASGDTVIRRVGAAEDPSSFRYTYDVLCSN